MSNQSDQEHQAWTARMVFFREALRRPLQVASIIPSSRFLERRVVEMAGIPDAATVVELGAGTGGTTQAILREMPANGTLLSIEINSRFYEALKRIPDQRLIPHLGSAAELGNVLQTYDLSAPEAVISGIPFSNLSPELGSEILEQISALLAPGGRFVAYQFRNQIEALSRPFLGTARKSRVFLNIPPLRVYQWQK